MIRPLMILTLGLLACVVPAHPGLGQGKPGSASSKPGSATPAGSPTPATSATSVTSATSADSADIRTLLAESRRNLFKPFEYRADLDSALFFANQAAAISRRIGYQQGIQEATLLTANIHIEAKRFPMAWALYNSFTDSNRFGFLDMMIRYREWDQNTVLPPDDSSRQWRNLQLPLIASLRNVHSISEPLYTTVRYYAIKHDSTTLINCINQGWRLVRGSGDIGSESEYLKVMIRVVYDDTAMTGPMLNLVDQLIADDWRILPKASGKQQFAAISMLTDIGLGVNYYTDRTEPGFRLCRIAMQLNQRLRQHNAHPWYILATGYMSQGNTKEALTLALEAVRVSEAPEGPVDGMGYLAATMIYNAIGDYEKGLEFFNKTQALYQKDPTLIDHSANLFHYGINMYLKQHRPAEALRLLQWTRQHANFNVSAMAQATADIYDSLRRYDSAEYYYRQSVVATANLTGRFNAYVGLADIYVKKGQYAKARPLIDTVIANVHHSALSLAAQMNAWMCRYQLDSIGKDYRGAMTDIRQYQRIRDSLINTDKNRLLAEIDVQYETEKKNQHIADLEKQNILQTRLQQATVQKDRTLRNGLIAGSALLAILAALLFNRYLTRQRTALRLQRLLNDKEWLLREIHHRVKNNLQIIISLLRMQSGQIKDKAAIGAFEEISARVNAISLVHKKLYQEGHDLASIEMPEYIAELTNFLWDGFDHSRSIQFNLDIAPVALDVAQCVPLGLIINEAITNSIKHAFPEMHDPAPAPAHDPRPEPSPDYRPNPGANGAPTISITLHKQSGGWLLLTIADNGVGIPANTNPNTALTLGLQLIDTLVVQLDGTLQADNRPGLTLAIRFPYEQGRTSPPAEITPEPPAPKSIRSTTKTRLFV